MAAKPAAGMDSGLGSGAIVGRPPEAARGS
jgi:hypothetical protein